MPYLWATALEQPAAKIWEFGILAWRSENLGFRRKTMKTERSARLDPIDPKMAAKDGQKIPPVVKEAAVDLILEDESTSISWLSRKDQDYLSIPFGASAPGATAVDSVRALQLHIEDLLAAAKGKHKKCWLQLVDPLICPETVTAALPIKSLRDQLTDESLILSLYDGQGYSFSSEYIFVFKGSFKNVRAFDDLLGVIQRALFAYAPQLTADKLMLYANYILRRAGWFAQWYVELFQNSCSSLVSGEGSEMSGFSVHKRYDFELIRIYLRKENSSLLFTVRCENGVYFKDNDLSTEEMGLKMISYQTLSLEDTAIQAFEDQVLGAVADKGSVPVSPSVLHPAGIRFYLLAAHEGDLPDPVPEAEAEPVKERIPVPVQHVAADVQCAELFGWGMDSYGALGLPLSGNSSTPDLFTPRPVPMPRAIHLERIKMLACSSRHTLLLTHHGGLYGMGDNFEGALGLGDVLPRAAFTALPWEAGGRIATIAAGSGIIGCHSMAIADGKLYGWGVAKASGMGSIRPVLSPTRVEIDEDLVAVGCGDAFTVTLTVTGAVYSWGQWSHGRLGLGPIPTTSYKGKAKASRYQLSPLKVPIHLTALAVGAAHVLGVTGDGSVVAWGANALGQLGTGPTRLGVLRDAFSPMLLGHFGPAHSGGGMAMKDGCNAYEAALCSNRPAAVKVFAGSYHSLALDADGKLFSWGARGAPCLGQGASPLTGQWAQRVASVFSLSSVETSSMVPYDLLKWVESWSMPGAVAVEGVQDVIAGDLHTAVLSQDKLLIAGTGPLVPSFCPLSRILEATDEAQGDEAQGEGEQQEAEDIEGVVVSTLRQPSACWLKPLSGRTVHYLGGAGCTLFAMLGDEVCVSLMTKVFKAGDVQVICSGYTFTAHKGLLAHRGGHCRDLLLLEDGMDGPMQILLPELSKDSGKAFAWYLYHDSLPVWALDSLSLLHTLHLIGGSLHIPRLKLLAGYYLHLLGGEDIELPPRTLCSSLGGLLGDPEHADIEFIASGRAIAAHRFVLLTRPYFQAMLTSGMREGRMEGVVQVVVPDSFVGVLRMLIFIYTGTLPDGSDGVLLEDLMAADR